MAFRDQTGDPVRRLAARLLRLDSRLAAVERRGSFLPVLDADPASPQPGQVWMLNDGRLRGVNADGDLIEWTNATTPGGSTSTNLKPAASRPHQHQSTYSATDAACYCPVHGKESQLFYGQIDSTHGERRVMFAFDSATIRSDLNGATVRKVEMKVRNLHSHGNGGVDIHWGGHRADDPLAATYSAAYRDVWSDRWPRVGGDDWREMPQWFGRAFRDDLIRGLTIDQPSSSLGFYGLIHSALDLRVTYTHKH